MGEVLRRDMGPRLEGSITAPTTRRRRNVYSSKNECQKVYYHRLGTAQADDILIYGDPEPPLRYFSGWESDDGRWLFVLASEGTSGSEVLFRPADKEEPFRTLLAGFANDYAPVECRDDKLYVVTNDSAANYRLARIDLLEPRGLETVIAEHPDDLLEAVAPGGGYLWVKYLRNAQNKIYKYDYEGNRQADVPLPAIGSVPSFRLQGQGAGDFLLAQHLHRSSDRLPLRHSHGPHHLLPYAAGGLRCGAVHYRTLFFESSDGEHGVPMFVSHRRGLRLDAAILLPLRLRRFPDQYHPCVQARAHPLHGAGRRGGERQPARRFGIPASGGTRLVCSTASSRSSTISSRRPNFSSPRSIPRAKSWPSPAARTADCWWAPAKCSVPDLFAVCLPAVGVMDMLRYHLFTIGWGLGDRIRYERRCGAVRTLYAYSPLHNISRRRLLPRDARHDGRPRRSLLVPAHSFKFAATLQYAQACDAPVLIPHRTECRPRRGANRSRSVSPNRPTATLSCFYNTGTTYGQSAPEN